MKKKYAFTFIEVMIAIVIFSVWILAVLSLVTHNLKSMDRNNLKLQATLLAKEWIELVYNLRDSNIEKELPWNCLMKDEMYFWSAEQLSNQLSRDEQW
jgi:Tfp pilus assembly protein PilV